MPKKRRHSKEREIIVNFVREVGAGKSDLLNLLCLYLDDNEDYDPYRVEEVLEAFLEREPQWEDTPPMNILWDWAEAGFERKRHADPR